MYVAANSVLEDKEVSLFLSMIGGNVYRLLHTLIAPKRPINKSYDIIVAKLRAHFQPTLTNIIMHRYNFHRSNQGPNETIVDYITKLLSFTTHCDSVVFLTRQFVSN